MKVFIWIHRRTRAPSPNFAVKLKLLEEKWSLNKKKKERTSNHEILLASKHENLFEGKNAFESCKEFWEHDRSIFFLLFLSFLMILHHVGTLICLTKLETWKNWVTSVCHWSLALLKNQESSLRTVIILVNCYMVSSAGAQKVIYSFSCFPWVYVGNVHILFLLNNSISIRRTSTLQLSTINVFQLPSFLKGEIQ